MLQTPPIIILFTSKDCPHCNKFRGTDGVPRESNDKFTPTFIKTALRNRKSSCLMELNVETLSNQSRIMEINYYYLISSAREIKNLKKQHGKLTKELLESVEGDSLERVSIKREGVDITVTIDGIKSDDLTEMYNQEYIWDNIPENILEVRKSIREGRNNQNFLIENTENSFVRAQIFDPTQYRKYCDNPDLFDNFLLNYVFDFDLLVRSLIPEKIRDYERAYPTWCIISSQEWKRGLENRNLSMYAKLLNCKTEIDEHGNYYPKKYTTGEILDHILENIKNKKILLEYTEKNTKIRKWGLNR